ncbi:MAG: hypothetical protein QOE99_1821 [Actinomycetota bacterium]|jgi:hypothetical protein|nr:hypothetical protein [Actinomycetota bacterium]
MSRTRLSQLLWVPTVLGAVLCGQPATALAAGPYPVNVDIHAHQAVEFDPSFFFDAAPCFAAIGDLTEVFNGEAHALAAGLDSQGNFLPPMHVQKNVEESVLFDPVQPGLPTYSGHSAVHVTNFEDSPNAGFTNTVILTGTDGSHLLFHEDVHILVKATGIVFFVDHKHARC